jgi:hypothetical protein
MKTNALKLAARSTSRLPRAQRSTAAAAGFPVPEASAREPLLPRVLLRLRRPAEEWHPADCVLPRRAARRVLICSCL